MSCVQADFGSTSQYDSCRGRAVLEDAVDKIKVFHSIFVYFDGRVRPFWRQRQTRFRHFSRFLSTSMGARGLFGGCGRQNQGISLDFCLLRWSRTPFSGAAVDKIQAFCSIFVYFEGRARPFWGQWQTKFRHFSRNNCGRPPLQEQILHSRALHFIKKATRRNGMSQAT